MRVTVHIDGGSRGNPGPAAAGVVITAGGKVIHQAGIFLGNATNNIAEYSGLVAGLKAAGRLGATEVEVVSDSELLVRQMNGEYRVRNEGIKPLYEQASHLASGLVRCDFRHVPREKNVQADKLVNKALDLQHDVSR